MQIRNNMNRLQVTVIKEPRGLSIFLKCVSSTDFPERCSQLLSPQMLETSRWQLEYKNPSTIEPITSQSRGRGEEAGNMGKAVSSGLIRKTTGLVEATAQLSLSPTGPGLPTGYKHPRLGDKVPRRGMANVQ